MTVIELSPDRPRRSTGPKTGNAVILVLPVIRIERYPEDGYELVSEAAQKLVRRSINLLRRARKASPAPLDGDGGVV